MPALGSAFVRHRAGARPLNSGVRQHCEVVGTLLGRWGRRWWGRRLDCSTSGWCRSRKLRAGCNSFSVRHGNCRVARAHIAGSSCPRTYSVSSLRCCDSIWTRLSPYLVAPSWSSFGSRSHSLCSTVKDRQLGLMGCSCCCLTTRCSGTGIDKVHARHRHANIAFSVRAPQGWRPPAELGR
jgi:hypothetical protein